MLSPVSVGAAMSLFKASLPFAVVFFFLLAESAGSGAIGDSVGDGGVAAGLAIFAGSTVGISGDDVHIILFHLFFVGLRMMFLDKR